MAQTILIDVPRAGLGNDLAEALAAQGLQAKLVQRDDRGWLEVRFADEHERLLDDAIQAIEGFLSDRTLPFVVQRSGDGAVVRPPGAGPAPGTRRRRAFRRAAAGPAAGTALRRRRARRR